MSQLQDRLPDSPLNLVSSASQAFGDYARRLNLSNSVQTMIKSYLNGNGKLLQRQGTRGKGGRFYLRPFQCRMGSALTADSMANNSVRREFQGTSETMMLQGSPSDPFYRYPPPNPRLRPKTVPRGS